MAGSYPHLAQEFRPIYRASTGSVEKPEDRRLLRGQPNAAAIGQIAQNFFEGWKIYGPTVNVASALLSNSRN